MSSSKGFLRPNSRYLQNHFHHTGDEPASPLTATSVPRLPSVSRRLSLTIPVVTNETVPAPAIHPIPIRFSTATNGALSSLANNVRTSSAILRPVPKGNALQRQKTDLTEVSLAELPATRRAEVMAREAIQGVVRFQEQQQQQQQQPSSNSTFESNTTPSFSRSPSLSRRVIINLKNNQSVSLDSRLLSASPLSLRPPTGLYSSRPPPLPSPSIQMPSHPATLAAETPPLPSSPPPGSYKNEFHLEIPVTIVTSAEQENSPASKEEALLDDDQRTLLASHPNHTLKSILKRSSSRETVSRKNVSFMNA